MQWHLSTFLRRAFAAAGLWLALASALISAPRVESSFETTTDAMRRETQWVVRRLEQYHYSRVPIAELDLQRFLQNYLSDLDYHHLYLLQEDVDAFQFRFGSNLRGWLARGDLYPAFQVFKRYRERALERIDWVFDRLQQDFSFAENDTYMLDRSKEPWPRDQAEAHALWEARLKYELLNELLPAITEALKTENEPLAETSADTPGTELTTPAAIPTVAPAPSAPAETIPAPAPGISGDPTATFAVSPYLLLERADFQPKVEEAVQTVRRRYERWRKTLEEIEPEYVQERYLTTLANLYDPHSTFLSADSLEEFAMAMKNSFVGIGALLQDDDGFCTIRELLPGGPAEQSRLLKAGDVILGVGQSEGEVVDVVDMSLRKVVKLIKGPLGSEVRLLIRPVDSSDPSSRKVVSLLRDEVKLTANLASARVFQLPLEKDTVPIGVIELPSFYGGSDEVFSSTTQDVAELIQKLKDLGAAGIILDLRRNGGGLLNEAVTLTGLFIPQGPVVQIRNTLGQVDAREDEDPSVVWDGPLVVLVSRYSASASEIVAGALQTHRRAIILGDRTTHGKGTVQAILEPNNQSLFASNAVAPAGAAKITIQKFYLPNGASTQKMGVASDIALPSINEYLPIGESDLDNALAWDTINPVASPVSFDTDPSLQTVEDSLLETLRGRSQLRQSELPEFTYLNRSISYYQELRDNKRVSLNLLDRLRESREDQSFNEEMRSELKELTAQVFPSDDVLLNVALAQEEQSAETRLAAQSEGSSPLATDPDVKPDPAATLPSTPPGGNGILASLPPAPEKIPADEADEEDLPEFDIHLREGLRVMRDWVALELGLGLPPDTPLTVQHQPAPADSPAQPN